MSSAWVVRSGVAAVAASLAVSTGLFVAGQDPSSPARVEIFGFSANTAGRQAALEARFLPLPSAERVADAHAFLTREPHVAGSPRDRELAEWVRDEWRRYGFDEVEIVEHEVLLPYPEEVSVALTAPIAQTLSLKEDPIDGDPATARADVGIPHHAYSASGDVTAPLVYAGSGNPSDYDWLATQGIDIKGKIALRALLGTLQLSRVQGADGAATRRRRHSHLFRSRRRRVRQRRRVPGRSMGTAVAHSTRRHRLRFSGPGRSARHRAGRRFQERGAFRRPRPRRCRPLSARRSRGRTPKFSCAASTVPWRLTAGRASCPSRIASVAGVRPSRLRVKMDDRVRPIWTVIGRIRGSAEPDRW